MSINSPTDKDSLVFIADYLIRYLAAQVSLDRLYLFTKY